MPDEMSLAEFIASSHRGLMTRTFGDDYLQKQTYLTTTASTFNQTYGRKVWDALNNRKVTFNALKKVPWGNTAGWVLRTDRGAGRVRPVTETGSLPTIDVSNYAGVYGLPKIPAATFGVPIRSIFVNTLEGGMGDILATEQEACERDFLKGVNQQLVSAPAQRVTGGDATTFTTGTVRDMQSFHVGDVLNFSDDGTIDTNNRTISDITTTTATVTSSTAIAAGDVVFVKSRAAFTSLGDIISEDGMIVGHASGDVEVDCYNLTTRTAAGYAAAAQYAGNSGVARDLTLTMLDTMIQKSREAGGEPKLFTMGWDQYFKMERLLNAQQRYMGQEEYQVGVGDERTLPGTRTGLVLATYMGIPILPEPDQMYSIDVDGTVRGTDVMLLDTDYLEVAVALPTQYYENRDYFHADALVVRGLLYMMAELRATRLDVHCRLSDLTA